MQVTLKSIWFNHDPKFETTGAFYIRRNETEIVELPEWENGRCTSPGCSPVAYAIEGLPKKITIKASFRSEDAPAEGLYLKAVADCGELDSFRRLNVLGDSEETLVQFQDGEALNIPFHFASDGISQSGASASDLMWHWLYRTDPKGAWSEIQTTEHRVYTVPRMPTCPWEPLSNVSANIQMPWTEALEYACHWATGVTENLDLATSMITHRVYALGRVLLKWQQSAKYAFGKFCLTEFLDLLRGGIGKGQTLNCDDCAAVVSTFSNLLGADLWQSSMGNDFQTNPVLLIGDSHWRRVGFSHHSVAWKGPCTENDELFDACLQVDGDGKPNLPPQRPKQPTNMQFHARGNNSYKSALFLKGSCNPIPEDPTDGRQRRQFGSGWLAEQTLEGSPDLDRLKTQYDRDLSPTSAGGAEIDVRSLAEQFEFPGLTSSRMEHFELDNVVHVFHKILEAPDSPVTRLIDLHLYESIGALSSSDVLLRVLSCFESGLSRSSDPAVGEIFLAPDADILVFKRERFVAVVRSVGRESLNIIPSLAQLLYM